MEFLDEDAKQRSMFQSRAQQISDLQQKKSQPFNKPHLFFSFSISTLIFSLTFLFINSKPLNTLLFWLAFSFLLGPFAPTSVTAGDIRVDLGSVVQFSTPLFKIKTNPPSPQFKKKTTKSQQRSEIESGGGSVVAKRNGIFEMTGNVAKMMEEEVEEEEGEKDWSEEDFEVFNKQMVKHSVAMPRRWEVILMSVHVLCTWERRCQFDLDGNKMSGNFIYYV